MFLEGSKIILREVRESDLELFQKYRNDYEDSINYRTWKPLTSLNQEWYWRNIVNCNKHIVFTILCKTPEVVIGECRISNIDWMRRKGEIGILIGKEYRRKGYGSEALSSLVRFGFQRCNLKRLEALIGEMNYPSICLFEGAGFQKEGVLRKSDYYSGTYHDILMYSIINW